VSYGLALYTAATGLAVSLEDAKRQCGVALDLQYADAAITGHIKTATRWVELRLGRQLLTASWDLQLDSFPSGRGKILIPLSPLRSITSITYLESAAGASTTLASSSYRVITSREPGEVTPAFGTVFPSTYAVDGAVTIRFSAGYGVATEIPDGIRDAVKLKAHELYKLECNEDSRGMEEAAINLLTPYSYGEEFAVYAECA